jgi:succinate dehydrogenase hydrophobic anchor subunit
MQHVVPAVMKPARTLWHEVFGFLFLCIAIIIGSNGLRFYLRDFDGSPGSLIRVAMTAFCVLLFGSYGISSFLRARKISRS